MELNNKLHELCRELRKENALLLDTSKAFSAQELNQRKALTENFQETVEGITKRCHAWFWSMQPTHFDCALFMLQLWPYTVQTGGS